MTSKSDPVYQENLFRPPLEMRAAYVWLIGAGMVLSSGGFASLKEGGVHYYVFIFMTAMGFARIYQVWPLISQQIKLFRNKVTTIPLSALRQLNNAVENARRGTTMRELDAQMHNEPSDHRQRRLERKLSKLAEQQSERQVYIGDGFPWGTEHANRAYQVTSMTTDYTEIQLPFALRPFEKRWREETLKLCGRPWIHGLGQEKQLFQLASSFCGHTFIAGNVGTGKTTLMKLLSLGMLHLDGHTLVILDPKKDKDWRKAIQAEMAARGELHKFYYFDPSEPSQSVRIDPLRNFNRNTEIAARLSNLQATKDGDNDPFKAYGWQVIEQIVEAMLFIGQRPQITGIHRALTVGKNELCQKALEVHFDNELRDSWRDTITEGDHYLERLIGFYRSSVAAMHPSKEVEGAIDLAERDPSHYQRMTASLLPLFTALTASPLDELISPVDDLGHSDRPPIIDLKSVAQNGGVIYMSLDSLSDPVTAGYLCKLFLADLNAVAGDRYNYAANGGRHVSIFVDEVHAAVSGNEGLINMLAQGRAAAFQMFLATQTIPDLEAKTSPATAQRFLGLCNNFFSMRVNDDRTQQYVSDNFGEAQVLNQQITVSHGSSTANDIGAFSGGYSERLNRMQMPAFPKVLLGMLPNLQYVARLADGRRLKGRIPFILH
ncbi:conjugative transfer system coupling protein TraD [Neiella sp. HB171785]|uniref:Conjugative transfer system coupling protein TraD n=1 Tax=Neiella litorisoli TaxID=2771431 RepID=A0A8J6QJV2_9GAMM|nr:conjugative transfer system coupling protein TraD [Neiella litorisoli]MBD1389486.1 conjugative transfer system coupling protein TraD [Neiella litorisoli]